MQYHLAQANIARMRNGLDQPQMAGFASRIEKINNLADQSAGFVWRLPGSGVTRESLRVFESYFVPFDPELLFFNMSVWESVEHLRRYVFESAHVEVLRDRHHWIDGFDRAHLALWWIRAGHHPTIAESCERLRAMDERGPTPFAFSFSVGFPQPAA